MKKLKLLLFNVALAGALGVGGLVSVFAGRSMMRVDAADEALTLVTQASDINDGDLVCLASGLGESDVGVVPLTSDTNTNAPVSATQSEWERWIVDSKSDTSFKLKNSEGKFILTENKKFNVGETGADFEYTADGTLKSDNFIFYVNASDTTNIIYRFYNKTYEDWATMKVYRAGEAVVLEAPTSLTISESSISVHQGESKKLSVTPVPADADPAVTWSSSDDTIASVDNNGNVTGVLEGGPVTITATSTKATGVTATCQVTVTAPLPKAVFEFATNDALQGASIASAAVTINNISVSLNKNGAGTDPRNVTEELRLYTKSQLIFTAAEGKHITSIEVKTTNDKYGGVDSAFLTITPTPTISGTKPNFTLTFEGSDVKNVTMQAVQQTRFYSIAVCFADDAAGSELAAKVQAFVDANMHMPDYTENKGWCVDTEHHYYSDAKAALLALEAESAGAIEEFKNNDAFNAAQERYEAWAVANGDNAPYEAGSSSALKGSKDKMSYVIPLSVAGVSLLSVIAVSVFIISKKKRILG